VQQSNAYIIGFATLTTIILGGLMSLAAVGLKPTQDIAIERDIKKQILMAVMPVKKEDDVLGIFEKRIKGKVVDFNGDIKEKDEKGQEIRADKVDIGKEYKKDSLERLYPIFEFRSESNPNDVEAYIIPMYGNGLWDKIWGYLALSGDLTTVKGVVFGHKAETPGLGARISDKEIQQRYEGKKIFNKDNKLVAITMLKSEKGNNLDDHKVDGMSGATLTGKGVNIMLKNYLRYYQSYFDKNVRKKKENNPPISAVDTASVKTDSLAVVIDSSQVKKDSLKTMKIK
jgi:Na+-transporting NADH:ubiquinone oxidoreductase subunit C